MNRRRFLQTLHGFGFGGVGAALASSGSHEGLTGQADALVPARPDPQTVTPLVDDRWSRAALHPGYRFESFVEGPSNRFARALAMQLACDPVATKSPLVMLRGGTGCGKTHLLNAIGHKVLEVNKTATVHCVHAHSFSAELIEAIQANRLGEFRRQYERPDYLLIDDPGSLAGKEKTQEEFFHLCLTRVHTGKPVVMASDCALVDIPGLDPRIQSHWSAGLRVDIAPPDDETRIAILKQKAREFDMVLPHDVATHLAASPNPDIRALEGALRRLVAQSAFDGRPIDLAWVRELVPSIDPPVFAGV